jgi:uncharacterized protein YcfJ
MQLGTGKLITLAAMLPLYWSGSLQAATVYEEAQVLSSTPIYRVVESSTPSQECWEEEVVREAGYRDQRSATPGILGAVIGGALGNAAGHHKRNQQVGTVVGAILGGSIGRDIGSANASRQAEYVDVVERCRTVHNVQQQEKLIGYDVRYSYNGLEQTVRLPDDPGTTLRVRVDIQPVQ